MSESERGATILSQWLQKLETKKGAFLHLSSLSSGNGSNIVAVEVAVTAVVVRVAVVLVHVRFGGMVKNLRNKILYDVADHYVVNW